MTDDAAAPVPARTAATLRQLVAIQGRDLADALTQAAGLLAAALDADKVDAFLYDPAREALVALGVSDTPLGRRERALGLDCLPLAAGGGFVAVYRTGVSYTDGRADADPRELARVRDELGVRSSMAAPLVVDGRRQGVLAAAATRPDAFPAEALHVLEAVAPLTGLLIERARLAQERAEALRRAEAAHARAAFLARATHELHTPLTAVYAGLGLLDAGIGAGLPPEARAVLAAARQNAERLRLQIADLLAAGRLDEGTVRLDRARLDRARLDLRAVVHEAAAAVRPLLEAKGQALEVALPETLPVEGDRRLLGQVVGNLLINAHRHTPPGTRVAVSGQAPPAAVHLVVRDDGPGLPVVEVEALVGRSSPRRDDPAAGGLGLGLSVARGLAEAHGGRLWVENVEGGGALVRVTLPRVPDGQGDGTTAR